MKKIAIVGAGQAGLQLAIALLKHNFSVSLFSNRSAQDILEGKILSSQGMFHSALENERALGLDFWEERAPCNQTIYFSLLSPETHEKILSWKGDTNMPYTSIDQRIKFARWIDIFVAFGGKLHIQNVQLSDLNSITAAHDLTLIAGGKGEISHIFPINPALCLFKTPPRILSCLYIHNTSPPTGKKGVRAHLIPGIGEFFTIPGLTKTGLCEMMLFEGIPGEAFDCWQPATDVEIQYAIAKKLLQKYVPWEYVRFKSAEPTDEHAGLVGSYIPYVRHPFAQLQNGKYVFGIGDAVVLNDPIAGQGANSASKAAHAYLQSILKRGNLPFDVAWMQETFEKHWEEHARWATQWTNLLLLPPPPHVLSLLEAASHSPPIAKTLANGFDDPGSLFPWILDADATQQKITSLKISEEKEPASH